MKLRTILPLLLAVASWLPASADEASDQIKAENNFVTVTLTNGDTITGYIRSDLKTGLKNMFSKTGSIRQYINVGVKPKGGETKRYNASEVKEYRFLPNEAYPEGAVCVADTINSPGLFKPLSCVRGFAWELDRRDSGSLLEWDVWETTGGRNSTSRLVPAIGVKLKGANAAYIIVNNKLFNDTQLCLYLKKQYPELLDAWNEYYGKGPDAKAHRKELTDNPSTALVFYENFLKTHEPIVHKETKKDKNHKKDKKQKKDKKDKKDRDEDTSSGESDSDGMNAE